MKRASEGLMWGVRTESRRGRGGHLGENDVEVKIGTSGGLSWVEFGVSGGGALACRCQGDTP